MAQTPSNHPTRAPLFDPSPVASEPLPRDRRAIWVGIAAILAAALVSFMLIPGRSREETLARRTAVKHWAELYRQPTEMVDKYCEVHAKRVAGGDWLVTIYRPVAPGSGGYQIITTFRVDRHGASKFVERSEGRIE